MKRIIQSLFILMFLLSIHKNISAQQNTVRLDGGPLFNSIASAYASLGAVISAPHIIELLNGYNGSVDSLVLPIRLGPKSGSSAFNTIIIRPALGVVINLTFTGPSALIVLDSADFTILDGRSGGVGSTINWSIKNMSNDMNSGVIELKNGATNNIIRYLNCRDTLAFANTAGGRIINIAQSVPGSGGNNKNRIEHCIVKGGRRGIQVFGTGGDTGYVNIENIIRNNNVRNATAIGIFVGSETACTEVINNEIFMDAVVATDLTYSAIRCQGVGTVDIRANKIHSLTTTASDYNLKGIYTTPVSLTAPDSGICLSACIINVINNFVSIMDGNAFADDIVGVHISNVAPAIAEPYISNVFNNSMRIGGMGNISNTRNSSCLRQNVATSGSVYNGFNNISLNNREGGNISSLHIGQDIYGYALVNPIVGNSDFNIAYATDMTGRGCFAAINGTPYRSFTTINDVDNFHSVACEFGMENRTAIKEVAFESDIDLHLEAGKIGGDFNGKPLADVLRDIDGELRNEFFPYRGADEAESLKVLTVRASFQGFPNGSLSGPHFVGPYQLRKSVAPYNIISTCSGDLDNQSNARMCFGDSIPRGTPFYIVVRQRNHLETWSSVTTNFPTLGTASNTYLFNTSLSQAYGNNMAGSSFPFKIFGGDVNQDGTIDLGDMDDIDNDAYVVRMGCNLKTDVNDDGTVDITDQAFADNNSFSFVSVMCPPCTVE